MNVAGQADTCNTHFLFLVQWDEKIDTDLLHASGRRAEYKGFLEGTGYSRVHKPGSLSSVLGTYRGRENQLNRVVLCPSVCGAARMRLRSHTRILRLHNSSESTSKVLIVDMLSPEWTECRERAGLPTPCKLH